MWVRLRKDVRPWQIEYADLLQMSSLQILEIEEAYIWGFNNSGNQIIPARLFFLYIFVLVAVDWTHDARTVKAEGISSASNRVSGMMQDVIRHQTGWARHPLFLALVVSITLEILLDHLDCEGRSVNAVENPTRVP